MMSWDIESFRRKLEQEHVFPGTYVFKFIVPIGKKEAVMQILPAGGEVSFRESANGNYVSITSRSFLSESQQVLNVYMIAHKIEGLIAL